MWRNDCYGPEGGRVAISFENLSAIDDRAFSALLGLLLIYLREFPNVGCMQMRIRHSADCTAARTVVYDVPVYGVTAELPNLECGCRLSFTLEFLPPGVEPDPEAVPLTDLATAWPQ